MWAHPTASSVHWENEVPIKRHHERNLIGGPGWVFFVRENFELTQLPFPIMPRTDSNIEAQTVASNKRASLKRALPIEKGRMRPITQTVASKKRASLKRVLPIGKSRMRPIIHQSTLSKQ